MHIRYATAADIPPMSDLLAQLFSIEKDFQGDKNKQQRGLQLLLEHPQAQLFVAEKDGVVVGMLSVQRLISSAEGAWVGFIEDVVVTEHLRGQGIGRALLQAAHTWAQAQGLQRLQLLVDKNNEAALNFYAQQAWQNTALIALRKML